MQIDWHDIIHQNTWTHATVKLTAVIGQFLQRNATFFKIDNFQKNILFLPNFAVPSDDLTHYGDFLLPEPMIPPLKEGTF